MFTLRSTEDQSTQPVPDLGLIPRLVYHPFRPNSYLQKLIADVVPGPGQRRWTEPGMIDHIGFDRYLAGLTEMILRSSTEAADDLLPSRAGREEVERFIRRNLADVQLSVSTIATANAVSRRRLYQIFAGAGVGVAEFIRRTRLEKSRALLTDPAYDSMAIGQIAHEVGIKGQKPARLVLGCDSVLAGDRSPASTLPNI